MSELKRLCDTHGISAVARVTGVSENYINRCLASDQYTIHRVKLANAKKALDKPQAVG